MRKKTTLRSISSDEVSHPGSRRSCSYPTVVYGWGAPCRVVFLGGVYTAALTVAANSAPAVAIHGSPRAQRTPRRLLAQVSGGEHGLMRCASSVSCVSATSVAGMCGPLVRASAFLPSEWWHLLPMPPCSAVRGSVIRSRASGVTHPRQPQPHHSPRTESHTRPERLLGVSMACSAVPPRSSVSMWSSKARRAQREGHPGHQFRFPLDAQPLGTSRLAKQAAEKYGVIADQDATTSGRTHGPR